MNVEKEAKRFVRELKTDGFDDIVFPEIKITRVEDWGVTIGNLYYQPRFSFDCGEYFDHTKFREEFEKYLYQLFPACSIRIQWTCQELEIEKI